MKKTMVLYQSRFVRFNGKVHGMNVYHVTALHDANGTIRNFIEVMHVWTGATHRTYLPVKEGLKTIREMTATA